MSAVGTGTNSVGAGTGPEMSAAVLLGALDGVGVAAREGSGVVVGTRS